MTIEMESVQSTNLSAVGYDEENRALRIEFHDSGTYEYYDVPRGVYEDLMQASSHGSYHHDHIRGNYDYRKVR